MSASPAPRFSLAFQSDKSLADYGRLAAAAEAYGFDAVSVFGDLYFQPSIVALLAIAQATDRVTIGPACLNPFTLHPVEIAGQVAALDAASNGRCYLGLARGSWLTELGIDQHHGVEAIAEAAAVVTALLAGDTGGVEGRRFRLPAGAALETKPLRPSVPLLVGTWGRRLAGIAGRFADEVKVGGSANPAIVPLMREWVDAGASSSGRQVGEVGIVVGAVTVVDHDRAAARRRARREVAMYLEVVGGLDPTVELDPELLARLGERLRANDPEGAGALVPDELLPRFCFTGTPDDVVAQGLALIEAGASRIEFGTPHGLRDDAGVELLGRDVLPALRSELATET